MKNTENLQHRLSILNYRYDKLLELNQKHHYTFMILGENAKLIPNPKEEKYTNLLLKIRVEKRILMTQIRETNLKYCSNINNGIKALISLSKKDLHKLTSV